MWTPQKKAGRQEKRWETGKRCSIHFFLLVHAELAGTHVDKKEKTTTVHEFTLAQPGDFF